MKILFMCEGPNEKAIIDILIKSDQLIYTIDDLLELRVFHARQLNHPAIRTAMSMYDGEVKVIRVGDKMSDTLKIPKEYADRITSVERCCTRPELEMLFIIAEGLVSEFEKTKSKKKPKQFCKEHISHNKKKYNNSTLFYHEYFGDNPRLLTDTLKEYKRISRHNSNDGYIADLIREHN